LLRTRSSGSLESGKERPGPVAYWPHMDGPRVIRDPAPPRHRHRYVCVGCSKSLGDGAAAISRVLGLIVIGAVVGLIAAPLVWALRVAWGWALS
jgi:hypothetical protein